MQKLKLLPAPFGNMSLFNSNSKCLHPLPVKPLTRETKEEQLGQMNESGAFNEHHADEKKTTRNNKSKHNTKLTDSTCATYVSINIDIYTVWVGGATKKTKQTSMMRRQSMNGRLSTTDHDYIDARMGGLPAAAEAAAAPSSAGIVRKSSRERRLLRLRLKRHILRGPSLRVDTNSSPNSAYRMAVNPNQTPQEGRIGTDRREGKPHTGSAAEGSRCGFLSCLSR